MRRFSLTGRVIISASVIQGLRNPSRLAGGKNKLELSLFHHVSQALAQIIYERRVKQNATRCEVNTIISSTVHILRGLGDYVRYKRDRTLRIQQPR